MRYLLANKDIKILNRFYPQVRNKIHLNFNYLLCVKLNYNKEYLINKNSGSKKQYFMPIVSDNNTYEMFDLLNDNDIINLDNVIKFIKKNIKINQNSFDITKKSQARKGFEHNELVECYNIFKKSIPFMNKYSPEPGIFHNIMLLNINNMQNEDNAIINNFINKNIKCHQYNINTIFKISNSSNHLYHNKFITYKQVIDSFVKNYNFSTTNKKIILNPVFLHGTEEDYYNELLKAGITF
jgi:hypothetical protein